MIFKIKRYEYDAYISFLYYDKSMKEIICIPGRRKKKNLKVAAYCRVSTKEESQQGSIDSQALYYEQLINEKNVDKKRKIKPLQRTSFIQTDELRNMYDTLEMVEDLKKVLIKKED